MVTPYLPDIIQGVAGRVHDHFKSQAECPFDVFFDKGIVQQVRRSVFNNPNNFPLIWFVKKYGEKKGKSLPLSYHSVVDFEVIFCCKTETTYTDQEREDKSFKPILIPMADRFMAELEADKWFVTMGSGRIDQSLHMLPYWAMQGIDGPDQENMFKDQHVDAISIFITGLPIRRKIGIQC